MAVAAGEADGVREGGDDITEGVQGGYGDDEWIAGCGAGRDALMAKWVARQATR